MHLTHHGDEFFGVQFRVSNLFRCCHYVQIFVLLPLRQGQLLGMSWHRMGLSLWILIGFRHTGNLPSS